MHLNNSLESFETHMTIRRDDYEKFKKDCGIEIDVIINVANYVENFTRKHLNDKLSFYFHILLNNSENPSDFVISSRPFAINHSNSRVKRVQIRDYLSICIYFTFFCYIYE